MCILTKLLYVASVCDDSSEEQAVNWRSSLLTAAGGAHFELGKATSLAVHVICSQNFDVSFLINRGNKLTMWSSLLTVWQTAASRWCALWAGKGYFPTFAWLFTCTQLKLVFAQANQTFTKSQHIKWIFVLDICLSVVKIQLYFITHSLQNNQLTYSVTKEVQCFVSLKCFEFCQQGFLEKPRSIFWHEAYIFWRLWW